MEYIAFSLILAGFYLMIFKDFIKFKNYYLGRYFNKVFGISLVILNMLAMLLNLLLKITYFDIIFPLIIGIVLYKIKEKEFNYFLIKDDYYKCNLTDKPIRETVRGIVLNDKNEVAVIHIDYDDPLFEYRNHYELPGGGIEQGEDPYDALEREIEEEIGYTIKDIHYLTSCGIEYNPFNRIDNAYVFVCYVDEKTHTDFKGIEKEFIKGIEFININKLMCEYKSNNQVKVGKMIYNRDGRLLRLYKSCN